MINSLTLRKNKGALIIEVLVGIVLSSFVVLAILGVYSNFDDDKRIIVQSNRLISNSYISTYPIKYNANMAGWSFPIRDELGCSVVGYNVFTNADNNISFELYPVKIYNNGSNNDEVVFVSGRSNFSLDRLQLAFSFSANDTSLSVSSLPQTMYDTTKGGSTGYTGLNYGEDAIIFEPNKNCTLISIAIPKDSTSLINRTNAYSSSEGNYYIYNKSGGVPGGINYNVGSYIYTFGSPLSVNKFYVLNGKLRMKDMLSNKEKILLNNVLLFKFKYGLDVNDDGQIDQWSDTYSDYLKIKSLKMAMLVKSPIKEKKKNGVCIVTKNDNINFTGDNYLISELTGDQDWSCYRYKFISEELELRNLRWSPKLN